MEALNPGAFIGGSTDRLSVSRGTAALPSIYFGTDTNTGVYSPGEDQLAISTAGASRLSVGLTGQVEIPGKVIFGTLNGIGGAFEVTRLTAGVFSGFRLLDGGTNPYLQTGAEAGIVYLNADGSSVPAYSIRTQGTERVRIDSSGRLLVGTSSNSGGALLQVNGDRIRVGTAKTPASATDTGAAGEICWDASYVYVCTATNTWKRTAISTW